MNISTSTKILLALISFCLLENATHGQNNSQGNSFQSNTINSIAGMQHKIQDFKGKKIWIIVLSATHSPVENGFAKRIDSIALVHLKDVQTVVVPSIEIVKSGGSQKSWDSSDFNSNVIISQPIHTHIKSGKGIQDELFYCLTHATSNGHFDSEITGVGDMFIIDEKGVLIGVLGNMTKWNNQMFNIIMQNKK